MAEEFRGITATQLKPGCIEQSRSDGDNKKLKSSSEKRKHCQNGGDKHDRKQQRISGEEFEKLFHVPVINIPR